jgi:hypothetical protein
MLSQALNKTCSWHCEYGLVCERDVLSFITGGHLATINQCNDPCVAWEARSADCNMVGSDVVINGAYIYSAVPFTVLVDLRAAASHAGHCAACQCSEVFGPGNGTSRK